MTSIGRKVSAWLAIAAAVCLCTAAAVPGAELIDRVLAVVEGQIVTLSDVRAALTFGLVPPDVTDDPVQAALRRVVERRLVLIEVERYAQPDPASGAVDAALAGIEGRFKDAQAFEEALRQSPFSRDQLRQYVRQSLRIEGYLQQRFSSAAQPSEEEIAAYYKAHSGEFDIEGKPQPLSAVRGQVVAQIAGERRAQAIREWLADLWRRGSIVMLPAPPRGSPNQ